MSELSAAVGGSGPKHQITSNDGVTYPVSLVTQGSKIAYEKALFKRARETLAPIKGIVDKDYYERKMDALVERYEKGDFAMESDFGRQTLGKPGGAVLLLSILMGSKKPDGEIDPMPELDVMKLIAQKPEETAAVFKAVIVESFPGLSTDELADVTKAEQEGPLPKAQARAEQPSSA